jgi:hypothetical protein
MLSLPDEINENLTPEYSKAEIQAIKDEVDEERLVTDIERMLEDPGDAAEKTLIERLVDQLGQDDPDLYAEMYKILSDTWSIEDIKETMAPAGQKSYSIRLPRTGRFLLMLDTQSDTARMINARTYEKEECGWGELGKAWTALVDDGMEAKESWSKHYCREYPEVAPVQPGSVQKSAKTVSKPQKAAKVQKAPVEWASAYKPGQTVKIILNGDVGRLVKKGAWPGDWVVEIGQKVKTLSEGTFKKFDENEDQVQQETLHSVEASIPEPDPVPTVNEEPEEHQEQPMEQETQMEGQQSIEDYPEYMPDAEVIPPAAPEGAAVDRFHKVILDHINDLKRHVLADEWKMAQMDLEMIQDALNRGEDMAELEDDE